MPGFHGVREIPSVLVSSTVLVDSYELQAWLLLEPILNA